jgi:hypothetical protein
MTEQIAESSAATDAAAESSPASFEIPTEPQAYADWRMGKTPDAKPATKTKPSKTGEAATPENQSGDTGDGDESGAASEAATDKQERDKQERQPKQRSTADTRLKEVLADLQRAGLTPAELKTFKREVAQAAKPPEAPKKPEAPKRPDINDFATHDLFKAAEDKYLEEMIDYRADLKYAEREQKRLEAEDARRTADNLAKASERYGAEAKGTIESAAVTIADDAQIPSIIKTVLNDSKVCADLLYTLASGGEGLDEFVALSKSDPGTALRKLIVLEDLVKKELVKGAKSASDDTVSEASGRDAGGKFVSPQTPQTAQPPAKKTTQAPPPPREAGGQSGQPADAVDRAFNENDFTSFKSEQNRRDLARARGQ